MLPGWEEKSVNHHSKEEIVTMKHGKKYCDSAKLIEKLKLYDTAEALDLAIKTEIGRASGRERVLRLV